MLLSFLVATCAYGDRQAEAEAEAEQVNIVRVRFAGANANIDLRELPPPQAAGPVAGSRQLSRQQALSVTAFYSSIVAGDALHSHTHTQFLLCCLC